MSATTRFPICNQFPAREMKTNRSPHFMTARFDSTCAETGKPIKKGERIAYYPATRKAFKEDTKAADEVRGMEFAQAHGMADANY